MRIPVEAVVDAENENPPEVQRAGWQAILDNFRRHVKAGDRLEVPLVAAALLVSAAALAADQPAANRVQVNGMQMYYEVSGQGEPLIVLHGAYMNIPTMGAIVPRLAATHRVYALERGISGTQYSIAAVAYRVPETITQTSPFHQDETWRDR